MRQSKAAILALILAACSPLRGAEVPGRDAVPTTLAGPGATTATAASPASENGQQGTSTGLATLPFTYYAPGAGPTSGAGCGCRCPWEKPDGHCPCLRKLVEWATYCPKERVCTLGGCNSCGYKGVLQPHWFFGRYCVNGCGQHATFPNPTCAHGCKGCAAGSCP